MKTEIFIPAIFYSGRFVVWDDNRLADMVYSELDRQGFEPMKLGHIANLIKWQKENQTRIENDPSLANTV